MRHHWTPLSVVLCAVLAMPALAQQDAVHWHQDLESAKAVAKESGRLVLVHFWTPTCGPCLALEQNVFNQPGVAAALEAQYVPVKLNADENSATAQWFGITRVPTDVVVTPDGQLVGKLVSPPTPAGYVAEVTSLASKYASRSGQAYAKAAAEAPVQPQINSAYARLQVATNTPLAIAPPGADANKGLNPFVAPSLATPNPASANPSPTNTMAAGFPTAGQPATSPIAAPAPNAAATGPSSSPATINSPYPAPVAATPVAAMNRYSQPSQPPIAPVAPGPAAVAPSQVSNPYISATTSAPVVPQAPPMQPVSPMQTTPIGAANGMPQLGAPNSAVAPPFAATSPLAAGAVPPEGVLPTGTAPVGTVPDPRQLPPGAPPLAFDGYCPVSMRNSWKWISGNPQFGIVHLGRTYWFAGSEEQKQFWTDPNRYTPALSGMDPVLAIDHQQQVPGRREHSIDYDGMFYMFAGEATLQQFTANPQRYSAGVRQAMNIPRGRLVR